jgi:hypothetical protein
MFIIIVLFYGFVLWFVYYVMLGPLWSITGTDALFGSKLIERIVVTGRYPWNDQTLLSHKPEYVYYPSVFMLEALLAIVLNINVKTLWYTPLTMYLCVALVATLVVSLLRSIRSNYIKLLVALPIANWIIFNPVWFSYSNVTRALLFLLMYMIFIKLLEKPIRIVHVIPISVLTIAIILAHSQESLTHSIFIALYLLVFIVLRIAFKKIFKTDIATSMMLLIPMILLGFYTLYSFYVSTKLYRNIFTFIFSYINELFSLLTGSLFTKVYQSRSALVHATLTKYETSILILGFALMTLYTFIILLKFIIIELKRRQHLDMLAFGISIIIYGFIAISPLLVPDIGVDLFWRGFWCIFTAIAIWSARLSYIYELNNSNTKYTIATILVIVMSLFVLANIILARYHLISSAVYVHQAKTIQKLLSTSFLSILNNSITMKNIVIVDSVDQPYYEITTTILSAYIPQIRFRYYILTTPPGTLCYNVTYLNGLLKCNDIPVKYYGDEEHTNYKNAKNVLLFCIGSYCSIASSTPPVSESLILGSVHSIASKSITNLVFIIDNIVASTS